MKLLNYSFLSDDTNEAFADFREDIVKTSSAPPDLFDQGLEKNTLVIPVGKAEEWLDNLPLILTHQTATKRLSTCQVYGLERDHYEVKLRQARSVKEYFNKFNLADPLADDACYQMLMALSIPFGEVMSQEGKFIRTQELLSSLPLRLMVCFILFEIDRYNTFQWHLL